MTNRTWQLPTVHAQVIGSNASLTSSSSSFSHFCFFSSMFMTFLHPHHACLHSKFSDLRYFDNFSQSQSIIGLKIVMASPLLLRSFTNRSGYSFSYPHPLLPITSPSSSSHPHVGIRQASHEECCLEV